MSAHPTNWSNAKCIQWIRSTICPSDFKKNKQSQFQILKEKMAVMFQENGSRYNGKILKTMCLTGKDLKDELVAEFEEDEPYTPSIVMCDVLCKLYANELRRDESAFGAEGMAADDQSSNNNVNNHNSNNNSNVNTNKNQGFMSYLFGYGCNININKDLPKFTIIITGIPHKNWKEIHGVTEEHTIGDIKKIICNEEAIESTNFGLICGSMLDNKKTLKECGIGSHTKITFWVNANGGTLYSSSAEANAKATKRQIDFAGHPNIKRSKVPDCLFHYSPNEGYSVAKMPCGHAMEANSMLRYIESVFSRNCASIEMRCPLAQCKKEWDWEMCCVVAGLATEEYRAISRKRQLRQNVTLRECPHCGAYCRRNPSVAIFRMSCSGCEGGDWCWDCAQPWRGSGLLICNNKCCKFVQRVNEELRKSTMSVPVGWTNINVPEKEKELPDLRACPACLTFIRKPQGCKHMTCPACKHKFCYSCLKAQSQCSNNAYTQLCTPHKKQHFE